VAEFPGFTLWTDAYLGDTGHLSTIEHGAYLLLLITMWRNGGFLPFDDVKLARYSRLTRSQWERIKPTMLEFFTIEGDRISQSRLTDELAFVRQRSARQSENARAKSRKTNKSAPAMAVPNASQTATPTLTPTLTEEDSSLRSLSTPSAPKARGTRLSEAWVLPRAYGEWALEKGLPRDRILIEADKMRDWSINAGKTGVKVDWFAAWRNWVQKAIDDLPRQRSSPLPAQLRGLSAIKERIRQDVENGRRHDDAGDAGGPADGRFPVLAIANH
jgi:uncharacterized protein YdaU (DUF1376 family)